MIEPNILEDILQDKDPLLKGLDDLETGFFVLDSKGNMIRCNKTAREIFAVGDLDGWDNLHISKIDCILSTGLVESFDSLRENNESFIRENIICTNSNGKYMTLNMSCRMYDDKSTVEKNVYGFVENIRNKQSDDNNRFAGEQELQILSDVASALSSSNDLEQILNVILTGATASQGLGFNRAFMFMYDRRTKILKGHMAVGPSSPEEAGYIWKELESKSLSLPELLDTDSNKSSKTSESLNSIIKNLSINLEDDSIISKVCRNGKCINLGGVSSFDETTQNIINILGTEKIALVPMISKNKLTGLLAADNFITGESLSGDSIQLLQILANQGAVAMERAALYEEQKERSNQLEKMNELLAESQEHIIKIEKMSVIGELTSSIAHELRNPLTIVGGFAGLMSNNNINDEQREYLSIITSEIKRAETVLDQVLDFSKASKNDRRIIDFNKLIEKSLNLVLSRQRKSDLKIPLSLEQRKINVFGNYDQLAHAFYQYFRLVIENLMPAVGTEVRVEQKQDKAILQIRLIIDEEHREHSIKNIKQIFTASKASQRLTILVANESVKYHGGDFGLSYEKGQNPTFYVELPLTKETVDETVAADYR